MKNEDGKGNFIKGIVGSLCLAFAAACADNSDAPRAGLEAGNASANALDHTDIVTVTNSAGQSSQIVHMTREGFLEYRAQAGDLSDLQVFFHGHNYDLNRDMRNSLIEQGMSQRAATMISNKIADTYSPLSGFDPDGALPIEARERNQIQQVTSPYRAFGPSAVLLDENGAQNTVGGGFDLRTDQIYGENPRPAPFCVVTGVSTDFSGGAWTNAFLRISDSTNDVFEHSQEFGEEFSTFVVNHEAAHCMGADEPRADAIAAMIMLKTHPDPEKAMAFLEHYRDLRVANALMNGASPLYDGTAAAIQTVLDDYRADPQTFTQKSEAEIWSQATDRSAMQEDAVAAIRTQLQRDIPDAVRNRDFQAMADYLSEMESRVESPELREQTSFMHESMSTLAQNVQTRTPNLSVRGPQPSNSAPSGVNRS